MSTMLEKMCRAIALVAEGDDTHWHRYRDEAHAVLTALLEPDEGMLLAGTGWDLADKRSPDENLRATVEGDLQDLAETFRDMIRKAMEG